ncbi:MAG: hypothetical protein NXY57DRAFT_440168 [Lentinula lateritia]|uniref:Uncharacterized protein n=1 Tax=Lentinula lateritia TaxID=40482 RepID=A0ABQ8VV03_9AGAR|nr:MAG: hypothetical protein NXY57DRAFT_440168 [Lentinula lateritia]KAJ4500211.1 hypothetical protein C8R41DRAFT_532378 [Lentinula lateritia]
MFYCFGRSDTPSSILLQVLSSYLAYITGPINIVLRISASSIVAFSYSPGKGFWTFPSLTYLVPILSKYICVYFVVFQSTSVHYICITCVFCLSPCSGHNMRVTL